MLNKKLIALMAVLFLGACSDGDLSQNAQGSATEESESSKSSEVKSSSSKKVAKSSSSVKSSSSSSKKKSSSSTKSSSSSAKSKSSSSSKSKSSSSKEPEPTANSSSSFVIPASSAASILDFGTCAPARTPVTVGDTISWVMKPKNPTLMLSAVSVWTMPGGSPDYGSGKNALGRAQQTKYTVSGDYTANVVVNVDGEIYQVDCSPLHVNGAPITDCECSTATTSVDYMATPSVTWSVDGCKTSAGDALAYVWEGVPGETTYTKTFDAANPGYAPTLKVYSSDNTQLEVACPAVKVTEGPEFMIKAPQREGVVKLPVGRSIVALDVDAFNNSIFCQVSREDSPSGVLNGNVNGVPLRGNDYIAVRLPAGSLVKGSVLEFELDVPASCGVQ